MEYRENLAKSILAAFPLLKPSERPGNEDSSIQSHVSYTKNINYKIFFDFFSFYSIFTFALPKLEVVAT